MIYLAGNAEKVTIVCVEDELVCIQKFKDKVARVFAAGDICVKKVRQVATAVADGAIAGIQAAAVC